MNDDLILFLAQHTMHEAVTAACQQLLEVVDGPVARFTILLTATMPDGRMYEVKGESLGEAEAKP